MLSRHLIFKSHIFLKITIFLIRKKDGIWKMVTEKEMIEKLKTGKATLPPLALRVLQIEQNSNEKMRFDALVEAKWRNDAARYVVECKAISTPKTFDGLLNLFKAVSLPPGYLPMLFMPYLSEQRLQEFGDESRAIRPSSMPLQIAKDCLIQGNCGLCCIIPDTTPP